MTKKHAQPLGPTLFGRGFSATRAGASSWSLFRFKLGPGSENLKPKQDKRRQACESTGPGGLHFENTGITIMKTYFPGPRNHRFWKELDGRGGPQKPLQKAGRFASSLLEWCLGPPWPPRAPKSMIVGSRESFFQDSLYGYFKCILIPVKYP